VIILIAQTSDLPQYPNLRRTQGCLARKDLLFLTFCSSKLAHS
jgi:hypothetical protein